jgi:hypothetical protein
MRVESGLFNFARAYCEKENGRLEVQPAVFFVINLCETVPDYLSPSFASAWKNGRA